VDGISQYGIYVNNSQYFTYFDTPGITSGSQFRVGGTGNHIQVTDYDIFGSNTQYITIKGNDSTSNIGFGPGNAGLTNFNGFFANGDGQILIGSASGYRVAFDGTDLIMSSSNFFLGGESQYISGSDGNIEISSSNFWLDVDGNVYMSGSVTASALLIGAVDSDHLIYNDSGIDIEVQNFSASGDNVYISSSNFLLEDGNISASNA